MTTPMHILSFIRRLRRSRLPGLAALLLLGAANRARSAAAFDPAQFDGQRAYLEVADLVRFSPRDAGTPGAEAAARHLAARLQALGVASTMDTFTNATPAGSRTFCNVIGRLPGGRPGIILLGSHYDTKSGIGPRFQGANDSGSSSGALLELARLMATAGLARERRPEIRFAFFDGEECLRDYGANDGLHGSRHLAANMVRNGELRRLQAMILLDMVGDRNLRITFPRNSDSRLIGRYFAAAAAEGARERFMLADMGTLDDHEPFRAAGAPAVDVIDFASDRGPDGRSYWHTEEDRLDKISAASLQLIGRVTVRVINSLLQNELTEGGAP